MKNIKKFYFLMIALCATTQANDECPAYDRVGYVLCQYRHPAYGSYMAKFNRYTEALIKYKNKQSQINKKYKKMPKPGTPRHEEYLEELVKLGNPPPKVYPTTYERSFAVMVSACTVPQDTLHSNGLKMDQKSQQSAEKSCKWYAERNNLRTGKGAEKHIKHFPAVLVGTPTFATGNKDQVEIHKSPANILAQSYGYYLLDARVSNKKGDYPEDPSVDCKSLSSGAFKKLGFYIFNRDKEGKKFSLTQKNEDNVTCEKTFKY